MKFRIFTGAAITLALLLAACAPATPTEAPTQPPATEPEVMEPTEPAATEATEPAATEATTAGETPTVAVPVTGESTVMISESADYGPILTDGQGMSLYLFMADTPDSGMSTCYEDDGCSTDWPPLVVEGEPAAAEGVDATLLGTITRDDGTMQVTFNGWPLYLYHEDSLPGDMNGQALDEFGGLWYLVSPTGEAVQQ